MRKMKYKKSKNIVKLRCRENDKVLDAELLNYTPAYSLMCEVNRQVRMTMRYNTAEKLYIGRVGTLEFTCDGPK